MLDEELSETCPVPGTVSRALSLTDGDTARDDTVARGLVRSALVERRPDTGSRFDEMTRYALLAPGKLLRPLMLLTAAEAVGGRREDVLPAAAAVEHLHVASLVHDDIIDNDDLRRGRPSVHARYGVPDAIVTGDALLFEVFAVVAECAAPPEAVVTAVAELARAGSDLCRGQVQESQLVAPGPGRPGSTLDDYLEVAALKTGALFRGRAGRAPRSAAGTPSRSTCSGTTATTPGSRSSCSTTCCPTSTTPWSRASPRPATPPTSGPPGRSCWHTATVDPPCAGRWRPPCPGTSARARRTRCSARP